MGGRIGRCIAALLALSLVGAGPSAPVAQRFKDGLIRLGQASSPTGRPELEKWLGSAFLIDGHCLLATADHVIEDPTRLVAQFRIPPERKSFRLFRAEVIRRVPKNDMAFVRMLHPRARTCTSGTLVPIPLAGALTRGQYDGESVVVIGFPRVAEGMYANVPISRRGTVALTLTQDRRGKPAILLSLTGAYGFSGGPIIVENEGIAIGVMSRFVGDDPTFTFAHPIRTLDYEVTVNAKCYADSATADVASPPP